MGFSAKIGATLTKNLPRRKARKRIIGALVFVLFAGYFFLSAVPVEAAACATGADVTIATDCSWDVGTHTYTGTLTINSGVTVTAGNASTPGLVVVVAEDVDIQGIISANGLGFDEALGPGAGTNGSSYSSGAGYGGNGGNGGTGTPSGGATYGSVT